MLKQIYHHLDIELHRTRFAEAVQLLATTQASGRGAGARP
jgi:hypothetical protein